MEIIEYNEKYINDVKNLMVELQEYLVSIDEDNLEVINSNYRDKYVEQLLNNINKNDGIIYLMVDDNKCIGLICGIIVNYSKNDYLDYKCPKKGRVLEFIVNKNYRSKNVGKILIEKIEKYFKEKGCEYINVEVLEYNKHALEFYNRKGYHSRVEDMIKKIQ